MNPPPNLPAGTDAFARTALVTVVYQLDAARLMADAAARLPAALLLVYVDNTPGRGADAAPDLPANVLYLPLGDNRGIAEAFNVGIDAALARGRRMLFTFDQDSVYDAALLAALLAAFGRLRAGSAAPLAVGPAPRHRATGASYLRRRDRLRAALLRRRPGPHLLAVGELISSGLLSDADSYRKVGLYRADLFIDYVDHEWCWRLRAAGGRCVVDLDVPLAHMVGAGSVPFTFGMKHGAALRVFYLFRNGLALLLSGLMPAYDVFKFLLLVPLKLIAFSFLSDRRERLGFAFKGLAAGLRLHRDRRPGTPA